MIILLPPSETKTPGGQGAALDLAALAFPRLNPARRRALTALGRTVRGVRASTPAAQRALEDNRAVRRSPTMPAIERYTGVLYDAIGLGTLEPAARAWLDEHVVIHSALFGLVRAGDPIPAYKAGAGMRLAGEPLGALWRDRIARELDETPGLVLDLRSDAYIALGTSTVANHVLVTDGNERALGHFNKAAKGRLVRRLAALAPAWRTRDEALAEVSTLFVRRADGPGLLHRAGVSGTSG